MRLGRSNDLRLLIITGNAMRFTRFNRFCNVWCVGVCRGKVWNEGSFRRLQRILKIIIHTEAVHARHHPHRHHTTFSMNRVSMPAFVTVRAQQTQCASSSAVITQQRAEDFEVGEAVWYYDEETKENKMATVMAVAARYKQQLKIKIFGTTTIKNVQATVVQHITTADV